MSADFEMLVAKRLASAVAEPPGSKEDTENIHRVIRENATGSGPLVEVHGLRWLSPKLVMAVVIDGPACWIYVLRKEAKEWTLLTRCISTVS